MRRKKHYDVDTINKQLLYPRRYAMSFGDFNNFDNWSPKDHATNKMVFDQTHKGGGPSGQGGGNNKGCNFVIGIIVFIIMFIFIWCRQ